MKAYSSPFKLIIPLIITLVLTEHILLTSLCLSRRTRKGSSSRRIMRDVPDFILETHYQTNNKRLPKFIQTDNASSTIETAVGAMLFSTKNREQMSA